MPHIPERSHDPTLRATCTEVQDRALPAEVKAAPPMPRLAGRVAALLRRAREHAEDILAGGM